MVNSKKMSKSSIAVIVLSILLVLSLILGFTGAWFTDQANGDVTGTGTFGTVKITSATASVSMAEGDANEITNLVPGCKLKLTGTIENGSTVDVYYRYKVVATVTCEDVGMKTELENLFKTYAEWTEGVKLAKATNANPNGEFSIPTSIGNAAQGATVSFKLSVQFTQADHQTAESIVWENA